MFEAFMSASSFIPAIQFVVKFYHYIHILFHFTSITIHKIVIAHLNTHLSQLSRFKQIPKMTQYRTPRKTEKTKRCVLHLQVLH